MELLADFPTQQLAWALPALPDVTPALAHPFVGSFIDEHLSYNVNCDWKCILILSAYGAIWVWHMVIMIADMGAWAGGNLTLIYVTFYTSLLCANAVLQVLAPIWYWSEKLWPLRITFFSLAGGTIALELGIIID